MLDCSGPSDPDFHRAARRTLPVVRGLAADKWAGEQIHLVNIPVEQPENVSGALNVRWMWNVPVELWRASRGVLTRLPQLGLRRSSQQLLHFLGWVYPVEGFAGTAVE